MWSTSGNGECALSMSDAHFTRVQGNGAVTGQPGARRGVPTHGQSSACSRRAASAVASGLGFAWCGDIASGLGNVIIDMPLVDGAGMERMNA